MISVAFIGKAKVIDNVRPKTGIILVFITNRVISAADLIESSIISHLRYVN